MKNKQYTISVKHPGGAVLSIGAYCDITNDKYFRIYYNGSDIGRRYSKIGNAARYLESVAAAWYGSEKTAGTINDIETRGSAFNIQMFLYWYAGGTFPKISY